MVPEPKTVYTMVGCEPSVRMLAEPVATDSANPNAIWTRVDEGSGLPRNVHLNCLGATQSIPNSTLQVTAPMHHTACVTPLKP